MEALSLILTYDFTNTAGYCFCISPILQNCWFLHCQWRRKWQPIPVILPGKSHGWRSLAGTVHGFVKIWTPLSDWTFTFPLSPQKQTLEKEMATHSSFLVWRILWTEEPGRQQSMGLQIVGHDWETKQQQHCQMCDWASDEIKYSCIWDQWS